VHRYVQDLGWRDSPAPSVVGGCSDVTQVGSQSLEVLAEIAAACQACGLCEHRKSVVFGEGDPNARVLFIGEGPGAEEDRTGRPFVGQAGRLLDGMIQAMGLDRQRVYITNIVKCRPPGNRDPREEEVAACAEYLDRQVELIRPAVIVALGKPAAHRLTGTRKPIGALRGRWSSYRGIPLMPVFHPAFMLRNPKAKREAWEDLKLIMRRLATTND
jgi:DNA polymerase